MTPLPSPNRRVRIVLACAVSAWSTIAVIARVEQAAPRTVAEGVYTEAQAARGKDAYDKECASCHLESLGGADMAPGLVGESFMTTWKELTVGDLYERVRISMPADRPAALPRQQYADIVAYMLKVNKLPAGSTELGSQLDALKAITFTAK